MNENPLPHALDWYRQTANWLVGLSAASLAWLSTVAFDVLATHSWSIYLLIGAGLAMVLALLAGIYFYISLTAYGHAFEELFKANELLDAETDSNKKSELQSKVDEESKRMKSSENWYGALYLIMVICFTFGVMSITGLSVVHFGKVRPEQSAGKMILLDGRHRDDVGGGYSVLLLDIGTGVVQELHNDSVTGTTRWDTTHAYTRLLEPLENYPITAQSQ